MPQGYKDPGTLVAEIKMTRTDHQGAILLVEGKDDLRFWQTWRHSDCDLIDGEGKLNVVGSIQHLDSENFEGVLGIVDDDYDNLMNENLNSANLVATDAHDLECILCRSPALYRVLSEHGNPSKIRGFEKKEDTDVREGLLKRASEFGRLRWAALRCQLNINAANINVPRFVDTNTWMVDMEDLISVATYRNPSDADVLKRSIAELPCADPWYVVRGHDVVELLRIGLMCVLGDIPSLAPRQISGILRAGISREDLERTMLWTNIRFWETENPAYSVLKDWL